MIFHYKRDSGANGRLHRINGLGSGVSISNFIQDTPFPIHISLQILSYIADALTEAHKNNIIHGNIRLQHILLSQDGGVIINGFGQRHRNNIVPEERPKGAPTDVYCLGILLLALLSQDELFTPPHNPKLHAETIVERMLFLNWQEIQHQPWLAKVQEFLISTMAFSPSDRPNALDIANVLSGIIPLTNPNSLNQYIAKNSHYFEVDETEDTEELEEAISMEHEALSPISVVPDSAQGAATGLWPREKILELLQENTEEKAERQQWNSDKTPISNSRGSGFRRMNTNHRDEFNRQQEDYHAPPPFLPPPEIPDKTENSSIHYPEDNSYSSVNNSQAQRPSISQNPIKENRDFHPPPPPPKQTKPPKKTDSPPSSGMLFKYIIGGALLALIVFSVTVFGVYSYLANQASQEKQETTEVDTEDSIEENNIEVEEIEENKEEQKTEEENKEEETKQSSSKGKKETKKQREAREKRRAQREARERERKEKERKEKEQKEKEQKEKTSNEPPMIQKKSFQVKIKVVGMSGRISCGDGQNKEFTSTAYFKFRSQQSCVVKNRGWLERLLYCKRSTNSKL